jgi:hypothetical protein
VARLGVLVQRHPVLLIGLLGCALYLAAASSPTTGFWSHRFYGDSDVYGYYAQRIRNGEVPYRDFLIEYPPGSLVAFVPPILSLEGLRHLGISGLGYTDLFKTAMLLCGLLIVFTVASTANFMSGDPRRVLAAVTVVGVSPLVLGPTALSWYDIWPTLLTVATVALFVRRHYTVAFAVLGIAVAAKLFALVLLPLLFLQATRTVGWKRTLTPAVAFFVTTAAFFGATAALSWRGARYPFTYLIDRPVEIESTAGSIVGLFHLAGWWSIDKHESFGSVNFEGTKPATLGLVTTVIGAVALLALWWRSALVHLPHGILINWSTAAIAIALATSKVFSPQYLVWLVPFVALTLRPIALLILTAALVLTRLWFPEHWSHFNNIPPLFALAAPRDLAVCLLAAFLIFGTQFRPDSKTPRHSRRRA